MSRELTQYDHGPGVAPYRGGPGRPMGPRRREPEEAGFKELWAAIWRQKWVVLSTMFVITGLAVAYVQTATPMYSAKSLVRIGNEENPLRDLTINGERPFSRESIETEIAQLESYQFSADVVDDMGLVEDPEFNPALDEDGSLAQTGPAQWMPAFLRDMLFGSPDQDLDLAVAGVVDLRDVERNKVVGNFRGQLGVRQINRSQVIEITFLSADANKAAMIANNIAELYIAQQVERKSETTRLAVEFFQGRVDEVGAQIVDIENQILGIVVEGGGSDVDQASTASEIAQINAQLAAASARRATAQARYGPVAGLNGSTAALQQAAQIVASPTMDVLRASEAEISRRLAELSTIYGERHPQIVNVKAELASIRARMNSEASRIIVELQSEVQVAQAAERQLTGRLNALRSDSQRGFVTQASTQELERELASSQVIYDEFRQRLDQLRAVLNTTQANAVIVSRADPPVIPAFPNKKLIVALAAFCAAAIGLMLVFVIERWGKSTGFRSSEELMEELGVKTLALVPDLTKKELQGGVTPEEYIIQKPHSAFAESLQRVRTSIFMGDTDNARTVVVTSSVPVEGKTLISQALARQSARSGLRTLLIDADLRRPRLHEVIRVANHGGLADVAHGKLSLAEAVRKDEKSGLHFLPAGSGAASPPDMFRSRAMSDLLAEASAQYDLVILDSPPVGAVSDSCILAKIADRTIYVVRWEQTPRELAAHGIQQIMEAGANLAGVVVSRVDMKKQARYGYGEAGYYQGYYKKYYVD